MDLGTVLQISWMGAFCQLGIDVVKLNVADNTLYLSIPKHSYIYESSAKIHNASEQAKNLHKTLSKFVPRLRMMYKEKDIHWTKEMGEQNFENNKEAIANGTLWDAVSVI